MMRSQALSESPVGGYVIHSDVCLAANIMFRFFNNFFHAAKLISLDNSKSLVIFNSLRPDHVLIWSLN